VMCWQGGGKCGALNHHVENLEQGLGHAAVVSDVDGWTGGQKGAQTEYMYYTALCMICVLCGLYSVVYSLWSVVCGLYSVCCMLHAVFRMKQGGTEVAASRRCGSDLGMMWQRGDNEVAPRVAVMWRRRGGNNFGVIRD